MWEATVTFLYLLLFVLLPTNAFCQFPEGFESGIPPTWTFSGPVGLDGTAQASSGITPTQGSSYGWISNGCLAAAGTSCPTVSAVASPGYVALGLGAGSGLGSPTTEVTLTSPSFSLPSPGVISFDVNFITTDGTNSFADFALAQLVPSATTPINLFVANTTCDVCAAVPPVYLNPGVATLSPSQAFFAGTTVNFGATTYGNVAKFGGGLGGPTGWIHVTYSATAGNYQLQFLVSHVGDTSYPSALAIDNVQVQTTQTVTQALQPTTTDFTFSTGSAVTKQTIDYTNSGTNPTGTTMQVTLRAISNSEFQNLTAGTFAQGSQCFPQDFGGGNFSCAVTIALCTNSTNTTPAGANCPQASISSASTIGVAEKYSTNAFVDPTTVPKPGYLAATDNALSCTNDASNTCRALHNIFTGIANDCCLTNGTTKTFNSLFIPVYNLPVWYQPAGTLCDGEAGHQILQPVNVDGSSVWKQGRTVPLKFRVCDVNNVSVGTPGVVTSLTLDSVTQGTVTVVDETTTTTTADSTFRFDTTAQQWVFNLSTQGQSAGNTYHYSIHLNDGTAIRFQYGLR
ncbi:MAG: hypothetical protein NVS1B11_36540 [Terriglobales bacterium]